MSWRTVGGAAGFGLLALGLPGLVGCLVTEKVDYNAPNLPSIVERRSPDRNSRLPTPDDQNCPPGQVAFVALVTDYDVNDSLEAILAIDGTQVGRTPISPTNEPNRGLISLCVARSAFTRPCSIVEFLVSSSFNRAGTYATDIPGDLGRAEWTVLGSFDDNSADAMESDCRPPVSVDAGVGDAGGDGGPDAAP